MTKCPARVISNGWAHAGWRVDKQVESCNKLAAYDWLTVLPGMLQISPLLPFRLSPNFIYTSRTGQNSSCDHTKQHAMLLQSTASRNGLPGGLA